MRCLGRSSPQIELTDVAPGVSFSSSCPADYSRCELPREVVGSPEHRTVERLFGGYPGELPAITNPCEVVSFSRSGALSTVA